MVITVSPRHDWLQIGFDLPYLKLGPWLPDLVMCHVLDNNHSPTCAKEHHLGHTSSKLMASMRQLSLPTSPLATSSVRLLQGL